MIELLLLFQMISEHQHGFGVMKVLAGFDPRSAEGTCGSCGMGPNHYTTSRHTYHFLSAPQNDYSLDTDLAFVIMEIIFCLFCFDSD